MKKVIISIIVLCLIVATTITKNSTNKIDKEIYKINESIRLLKNKYELVLLEHSYLTSPKKLIEYQKFFFDNDLIEKNINDFGEIVIDSKTFKIKEFKDNE